MWDLIGTTDLEIEAICSSQKDVKLCCTGKEDSKFFEKLDLGIQILWKMFAFTSEGNAIVLWETTPCVAWIR